MAWDTWTIKLPVHTAFYLGREALSSARWSACAGREKKSTFFRWMSTVLLVFCLWTVNCFVFVHDYFVCWMLGPPHKRDATSQGVIPNQYTCTTTTLCRFCFVTLAESWLHSKQQAYNSKDESTTLTDNIQCLADLNPQTGIFCLLC